MISEIQKLFLGNSPIWYKQTIVAFLIINPIALVLFNSVGMNGNFIVGWMFLLEFIFTLALALKCYPLAWYLWHIVFLVQFPPGSFVLPHDAFAHPKDEDFQS